MQNTNLHYPKLALIRMLSPLISHYYFLTKAQLLILRINVFFLRNRILRPCMSDNLKSRIDETTNSLVKEKQSTQQSITLLKLARKRFVIIQQANRQAEITRAMLKLHLNQKPPR